MAKSVRQVAAIGLERELEILEDGEVLEDGRLLELAADAEIGDRHLVELAEIDVPPKKTWPVSGRVLPVMTVHHRRLAGARSGR